GEMDKGMGKFGSALAAEKVSKYMGVILHTRFATSGGSSAANAHPFKIGHVIGAHNGAVWNHHTLNTRYSRDFPVDSMHVFAHIDEERGLNELDGYGAIEFLDDRLPGRILMGRFEGELSVAKIAGRGIVWSSSKDHVEIACKMAGLEPTFLKVKSGRLY